MSRDGEKSVSTDAWAEELAAELAQRLDGWAIGREKVLSKLDIRGAKAARILARSLRLAAKALEEAGKTTDFEERKERVFRIVELRRDALRLMSSGASPVTDEELAELARLGAEDIGQMVHEADLLDVGANERPTLAPPPPPGAPSSQPQSSESHSRIPRSGESLSSGPISSGPLSGEPGSAQSGERPRNEHITATHTPDAIRASRAQALAPKIPKARDDGGLGDYIARIRRLKG